MAFKVSTSEVATFLTCKQRWMYAHHPSYNLEPKTLGVALTRGLIGHAALEHYYNLIASGTSHEEAAASVQNTLVKKAAREIVTGDAAKAEMITGLGVILKGYLEEYKYLVDTYDILGVEHLVTAPLPGVEDIDFAGRIDLALGIKNGPNAGEVIPWDHKFCYNFWSESSIKMNAQISNYVWALRMMGYRSRKGVMNMLRYRSDAIESFKQEEVFTNSHMRGMYIENHTVAAVQIVDLKKRERVSIEHGVTRSPSKFNCEYCPFITLCYTEAQGHDSANTIEAHYKPNSYGYIDTELDVQ